jgi:putative cell wall-binding protein
MKKWVSILAVTLLLSSSFIGTVFAGEENNFGEIPPPFLEQEPNNSFEQATDIPIGDTIAGSITEGDIDFYKITIKERSRFSLSGEAEGNTGSVYTAVYDSNHNQLNIGDEIEEFQIRDSRFINEPGTYYIMIKNNEPTAITDKYTFKVFATPRVKRIGGADRYETAVNLAYAEAERVPEIILATGQDFPDALAAAPLAYSGERPILLTRRDQLPDCVKIFLKTMGVKKVTIIGGTGAVSQNIENYLHSTLGLEVVRIGGKDRFETAAKIAEEMAGGFYYGSAFLVNGRNFPDALTAAPMTAYMGAPILLTDKNTLPAVTANILKKYHETYVIGGTGVVSDTILKSAPNPNRISGLNRYETSVAVAEYFRGSNVDGVYVATGEDFPDALSASVDAGLRNDPIILTTPNSLHPESRNYFQSKNIWFYTLVGGTGAVSSTIEQEIWSFVK